MDLTSGTGPVSKPGVWILMAGVACHPLPTGDPIHLRNAFSELGWGQRPARVRMVSLHLSSSIWEGSPPLLMSFVEGPFVWGGLPTFCMWQPAAGGGGRGLVPLSP